MITEEFYADVAVVDDVCEDYSMMTDWFYLLAWEPAFEVEAAALVISLPNSLAFKATLAPFAPSTDFLLFSLFPATWLGTDEYYWFYSVNPLNCSVTLAGPTSDKYWALAYEKLVAVFYYDVEVFMV